MGKIKIQKETIEFKEREMKDFLETDDSIYISHDL